MTSKEIEELAGHRQVPAWVVKLVNDAIAIEREATRSKIGKLMEQQAYTIQALDTIRTLRELKEKNT